MSRVLTPVMSPVVTPVVSPVVAAEGSPMSDHQERPSADVELRLPADGVYVSVVRTTTAGLARHVAVPVVITTPPAT